MANNEQFQASVVAGIETPGSADAAKVFATLLKLVEQLEGAAKTSGQRLVEAFQAGKKPEELTDKIRILQRELKYLSTVNKGAELFKSDEVARVNEVNRAISAAARAYDSMRQSQALARYELGLEAKTANEAAAAMKVLEKNMKAVDLALQKDSGNAELQKKKQLLNDNHALLGVMLNDLKQQATQEKLNEQISQQNFNNAKARYAEVQRLSAQRKQEEGSASAQTRVSNVQIDFSQRGRDYAAQQTNFKNARIDSALMPGKEDIGINRLMAQSTSQYLGQIYKDAGLAQASIQATLRDGAKVRQLVGEVRDIETKLVAERAKGNINLQEEAKLLEQIRQKSSQISNARRDQNLNDPETRQARQDSQSRNMLNRASGEGGAALLAVQASLMANYSILNNTVGAMKAAVTTSVELEAAFRNVQAVTGTSKTEMTGLESKIMDVAAASKFSSLEVANAALILGQAGLSARQVGEALGPVVMLASAAGTSIAQAVDLVTSIIGVFDKNTSDIADIANKVTQAANSSKVSVEKLALGFQYVGNAASQVGISFEEVTAALAAMSNAGIKNGSTMGTGLRQFLTETEKPSQQFLATLQRLGLTLADIDFKSNGLIGVTKKLREAGFVASDAIKSFDVRGAAAFNALIANPAELERQYRLLQDTQAGVAANEIQMDSLKSQSTRLTTALGNLASAGFAPLSNLLTSVVGGFATLTQGVADHNVVIGIAGTALAGLAASGIASYLASMAAGALRLAAGAGTASVAVTALQTASKAGSLGTLFTSLAASVATVGTIAPVAGGAAAATWTLTGAVTALRTAFIGLSIVSGIGIAVALATAAFYAFEYVTGRAAQEIDALKASTNTAKGAFEEKDAAVKSLTKKIEDLTYRESNLRNNTEALKTESLALTSQFGAIGYQSDANNSSFDTMIGKLKALKKEMADIRKQSLETALAENEKLLGKQTSKLQSSVKDANGGLFSNGLVNQMQGSLDSTLVNYSPQERSKLQSALAQLKAGDDKNMGDLAGARLILQRKSSELEAKGGADSSAERMASAADKLAAIVKNLADVGSTRSEIAGLTNINRNTEAFAAFNNSGKFGVANGKPRTFEDSLPRNGNLETIALANAGQEGEKDPIKVFNVMKKEQEARAEIYKNRLKQITELELSKSISEETAATARQMVKAREEKEKNDLLAMADATVDEAELSYNRQKRLLQSQQKNAKMKGDKDKQAEIERSLGELEIEFKNRAQTSPSKAINTAEELRAIREQNIQNIMDKRVRTPGRSLNENLQERSLKVQADAADSDANESKNAIKTAQTMEEVGQLMDEAIEAKFEAKKKRLAALTLKQKAEAASPGYDKATGDIAHRLEMSALADSEDSKISSFADSFITLIEAAMNRLDTVTKRINETKRKISEDKMDSEDKVFAAQQELREVELQIATGKKVKSDSKSTVTYGKESSGVNNTVTYNKDGIPTVRSSFASPDAVTKFGPNGVSVDNRGTGSSRTLTNSGNDDLGMSPANVSRAIRETLNQRRNRLIVEAAQVELEENEKLLAEYGDNTTGLIGDLGEKYRAVKDQSKILRDKLKIETDEAVKAALQAELNVSEKTESTSFKDLREARGDKQKLQVDNFNIRKKVQENTEALPQEVTIDNLLAKLDDVWAKYQATVGQMNVVKVVGDGLTSVLGGATGALGNAFSAIVTGTKSVSSAFKDMAAGIIKAMIDILAQALAMQAVKGLLGFFGIMGGGGAGPDVGASSAITADFSTMAATGGLIIPGGIQRVKGMAGGGPVSGGISNKDSVPTMLMPGEFVMRKAAVDTVGTDYLHSLNSAANTVVSSSSPKGSLDKKDSGATVNVWVVSPDQKPSSTSPKDIIAVISDDINRGGSVKKLIKQVVTNQL